MTTAGCVTQAAYCHAYHNHFLSILGEAVNHLETPVNIPNPLEIGTLTHNHEAALAVVAIPDNVDAILVIHANLATHAHIQAHAAVTLNASLAIPTGS